MATSYLNLWLGASILALVSLPSAARAGEEKQARRVSPADDATPDQNVDIVVTGSRRSDTKRLESLAPVDSFDRETLSASGFTDLDSSLSSAVPSFNFPRVSGFDASAAYRPASLRGLSPDQTLVLVNGKRWHRTAQVNVKPVNGRGSNPVDLNTIPLGAVERIEVLRDGASAQYGSDAIAGVINILLDDAPRGALLTSSYGQRGAGDGETLDLSASVGLPLTSNGGFVRVSGQYVDRHRTDRSGLDLRQQYFPGDAREVIIDRHNNRQGDPELDQFNLFIDAELPLTETLTFYGFGNYQDQKVGSQGNFRRAFDNNTVRGIYPDGFLPGLDVRGEDYSIQAGLRLNDGANSLDLSGSYSRNLVNFSLYNSLNASLGLASPRSFDAGGLRSREAGINLDGVRVLNVGLASPVNIAFGLGYRSEEYGVRAGEPASYRNGGIAVLDGPNAGQPTTPGSQGFPGFQPGDAGFLNRSSWSLYTDVETNLVSRVTASVAGRFERYSDFGDDVSGKASLRYAPTAWLAIRGTLSTGFRAPTLGQQRYATTETTFLTTGTPPTQTAADIKQLPVENPAALALGARPLKAEKSFNLTGGLVLTPHAGFDVSIDYYRIAIDDRIVLSENLLGSAVRTILASHGYTSAAGARFFTNGVDTLTQGVDIVASYHHDFGADGRASAQVAFNWGETHVISVDQGSIAGQALIGRQAVGLIERGLPDTKLLLSGRYDWRGLGLSVRGIRYGTYQYTDNASAALDQEFGAQWVMDTDASYAITTGVKVAIGANNLFGSKPDRVNNAVVSTNGLFPYSSLSPDGFSGTYYYVRTQLKF